MAVHFNRCDDKIKSTYDSFAGDFPDGLNVTTDGKYVFFEIKGCILIEDNYYKVGADIVKGSNTASVYFYRIGTLIDEGLTSHKNAADTPAGLINLTFFVESEQPLLIVAFKSYIIGSRYITTENLTTAYPLVMGGNYSLYLGGVASESNLAGHLTMTVTNLDGHWEINVYNYVNPAYQVIQPLLYAGDSDFMKWDYTSYPYPGPNVKSLLQIPRSSFYEK